MSGRSAAVATAEAVVASVAATLNAKHIKNILSVTAGPASSNKLVQTALVAMDNSVVNGTSNAAGDAIKTLRADIKPLMQGSGLSEGVTGTAAQQLDSQQSGNNAEKIVTMAVVTTALVSAAVIAARVLTRHGDNKQALKLIESVWSKAPHPDLAAAYLDALPGESNAQTLERVKRLAQLAPAAPESCALLLRDVCAAPLPRP